MTATAIAAEASAARRFGVARAIDGVGTGLFIPVSLLYFLATTPLSTVRIGLALTLASLLSIPCVPLIGALVDRVGAKPVLQAGNLFGAAGFFGYLFAQTFSTVLVCAWVVALGRACFLGSYGVTVTALSEAGGRELAFGRMSAVRNLGYAGGGLLAGVAISIGTHTVYSSIVVVNAISFLVAFALMSPLPNPRPALINRSERAWRIAVSDRPYRVVIAAQFCLTASAFALYYVFPIYLFHDLGLPGWLAGGVFTFNALLVGFAQSGAVRAVAGRARFRVLAAGHAAFGIGYLMMLGALHRPAALAGAVAIAGTLVYTAGELLASPMTQTLAAEAAPDHLRGRYLSLNQLSVALATAMSPATFTFLLTRGPSATWLSLTALAMVGTALSVISGRVLPTARTRVGQPDDQGRVQAIDERRREARFATTTRRACDAGADLPG
ncbi:MAG TPA: MFS transporter [Gaiellaceae bacterium]|nr:MFS transporter [Gaiellaceae bacterium]